MSLSNKYLVIETHEKCDVFDFSVMNWWQLVDCIISSAILDQVAVIHHSETYKFNEDDIISISVIPDCNHHFFEKEVCFHYEVLRESEQRNFSS